MSETIVAHEPTAYERGIHSEIIDLTLLATEHPLSATRKMAWTAIDQCLDKLNEVTHG